MSARMASVPSAWPAASRLVASSSTSATGPLAADDGGVFERRALTRREPVQARGDEPVQRGGEVGRAVGSVRVLADHGHELFDEERVAAAPLAQEVPELGIGIGEQGAEQGGRIGRVERLEVELHRVVAARGWAPVVDELGACGGREDHRERGNAGEEPREEIEQLLVGPVQVREHEDERTFCREPAEERERGPERILERTSGVDVVARATDAHEVEQAFGNATGLSVVVSQCEHALHLGAHGGTGLLGGCVGR